MHTPDLYKFKSSLRQIEDPLEKLDYVIVNAIEASNELGQIVAQQYWGKQIPEEEYEKIYFDYCEFIDWCKEEISCLEDNYPLKIENRKKAAWPGHKILEFPLVWNHEIYNLIEPEVKKAGKKMEWLEWLLIRIVEGPGEYWKFEDHVCNAAYLDYDYYMNRNIGQGDPEEMLHLTGLIKSKFIEERLYLAKEIWSLKSKSRINKKKKQTSVKKKEISDHPVNILAIRTITDRFERGQKKY